MVQDVFQWQSTFCPPTVKLMFSELQDACAIKREDFGDSL